MKKADAEIVIRSLVHQWAAATGVQAGAVTMPSFLAFKRWAEHEGYGSYFTFRSTMGPLEDCERWFDQELRQAWRN